MSRLFVDHLTVIDFSYLDAERGIVGESWIVDLQLDGALNEQGMVFDFGPVKKQIKAAIDAGMDHRFVVPRAMPGLTVTTQGEQTRIQWSNLERGWVLDYQAPHQAFFWLDGAEVSTEAARQTILQQLQPIVPNNVSTIHLTLRAEPPTEAQYHYSHGLKKHDGDCQRMIHGHRSNIQIFHNQQRSRAHEQQVAAAWQDIYLVTQEDIVGIQSFHGIECYVMRYQAQQGEFQLSWPVARCDVLNTDSTVELIAEHLLHKLVAAEPTSEWMVKAYEGVHKGAYAHYVPAAAHKDTP